MWRFFKNIIQLIISPDNGWDDINRTSIPARAQMGAIWCLCIATMSPWVKIIYYPDASWLSLIESSIITLISYGLTYYFAGLLMSLWLPRINGGIDSNSKIVIFNSYIISLLTFQVMVVNILPLTFAIFELWPVYVSVIMWRGMKCLDVEEQNAGKFIFLSIITLVIPALLLYKLFYFIL